VLLAIVGGWEAYVQLSGIDEFILPAPSAIAAAIDDDAGLLWSNFAVNRRGDRAGHRGGARARPCLLGRDPLLRLAAPRAVPAARRLTDGADPAGRPAARGLVWLRPDAEDRDRRTRLLLFPLEIYVPAAKRRWGYYVLPILHRERIVARADAAVDREAGVLHVNALYREPGVKRTPALKRAIADALQRLAAWRGSVWPGGTGHAGSPMTRPPRYDVKIPVPARHHRPAAFRRVRTF